MRPETLALALVWYVAFLLSLTCHEASHALAAKLGGDLTAFHGGQVTLNPIPHMRREPFGTILVPIMSYALGGWMIGWASAPYDPQWRYRYSHRAALMALAGPAANATLVFVSGIVIRLGMRTGVFVLPMAVRFAHLVTARTAGPMDSAATFLSILFSLNLLLAAFNLLPFPPLDGNSAIALLMSEDAARRVASFSRTPPFAVFGLLLGWYAFGYIFHPIFGAALRLLYSGIGER
jgi:Zn-dependent protease